MARGSIPLRLDYVHTAYTRMNWLNPPEGLYTKAEYLEMYLYWANSISVSRNKLAVPVNPYNLKFFGNKKVTRVGNMMKLEDLHESSS
jgi:hypothetical protein